MKHIRKSNGTVAPFNSKKINSSVKKVLISNFYSEQSASLVARKVTAKVVDWLSNKTEVTYLDIRNQTTKQLEKYDKNVAMLYKKHKDLW